MKRSKVFLAITTTLLTVAGLAATKVHRAQIAANYKPAGVCKSYGITGVAATTTKASSQVTLTAGSPYAGKTLFTASVPGRCVQPLYTGGI